MYDLTVSFDSIVSGSLNTKQLPVIFKFNSSWEPSGFCEQIWIILMLSENWFTHQKKVTWSINEKVWKDFQVVVIANIVIAIWHNDENNILFSVFLCGVTLGEKKKTSLAHVCYELLRCLPSRIHGFIQNNGSGLLRTHWIILWPFDPSELFIERLLIFWRWKLMITWF